MQSSSSSRLWPLALNPKQLHTTAAAPAVCLQSTAHRPPHETISTDACLQPPKFVQTLPSEYFATPMCCSLVWDCRHRLNFVSQLALNSAHVLKSLLPAIDVSIFKLSQWRWGVLCGLSSSRLVADRTRKQPSLFSSHLQTPVVSAREMLTMVLHTFVRSWQEMRFCARQLELVLRADVAPESCPSRAIPQQLHFFSWSLVCS